LGSTRLVTDENKDIVSALTYHPFGELAAQEGSEEHLFTGKKQDATGLYYYGARYYDPKVGRFITRDQTGLQITNPRTLNRYTYCANNPVKYIDPNGLDYFLPEWAHHEGLGNLDPSASDILSGLLYKLWVLMQKFLIDFGRWQQQHPDANYFLGGLFAWGSATGTGAAFIILKVGSWIALGIVALLGIAIIILYFILSESAEFYYDLWLNDPKFRGLWNAAETYADLLMMGADCYGEALDAFMELLKYIVQQKYGDNWEEECDPLILALIKAWEELQKKEKEDSVPAEAGGNYTPPPGIELD